jgi:hypothetical protein
MSWALTVEDENGALRRLYWPGWLVVTIRTPLLSPLIWARASQTRGENGRYFQKRRDERGAQSRMKMGFCGGRIGPAVWWLQFAPPFYPPSFEHEHPKRGGKRTLFSEETFLGTAYSTGVKGGPKRYPDVYAISNP